MTNEDIAYDENEDFGNPAIISRIMNNKYQAFPNRRSPNPFLIPPSYINLLKTNLRFSSECSMLFGDEWELEMLSPLLFQQMIMDMLYSKKGIDIIETLLLDSVAYSKAETFFELFESELIERGYNRQTLNQMNLDRYIMEQDKFITKYNHFMQEVNQILGFWKKADIDFHPYFNFNPENWTIFNFSLESNEKQVDDQIRISEDRQCLLQLRIYEIYCEINESFTENIKSFFYSLKSFKQLSKHMDNFWDEFLIPALTKLINQRGGKDEFIMSSLGHRVRQIIKNDVVSVKKQKYLLELRKLDIFIDNQDLDLDILEKEKMLLNVSLSYIEQLETYQKETSKIKKKSCKLEDWSTAYLDKLKYNWFEI
ncbi:hypothetical protein [Streptococcus varani]|uniref:hypothetical protein n=1 Tax=Streptococcus varani TaxID=1608583 RepID=UPI000B8A5336|nr:hypothetical protein [Streptococcus varani]